MRFLIRHLQTAESFARRVEKSRFLLITVFTILYLVSTYVLVARRLLWNDELYTYYIARLPSMTDVWGALMAGGEQLPPFFYVITRASTALLGFNNFGLRLPEIFGFWVMCLCLFVFVARRASNVYGLLAAIFPLLTNAYYYAYEARPYGLILGFGALALLCWQSATINYWRRLSIVCLTLSLAAALSTHYYGIFVIPALAFGETVRTVIRRRLDAPVWAAFCLAVAPLLLHLPLIRQARAYSGGFWAVPQWMNIPDFYYNLLISAVLPLVATLVLAAIYLSIYRVDESRLHNSESNYAVPVYEIAAAFGFVIIPIICVILAKFVTGAFTDRYAIAAVIGCSVLFALIAAKLFGNSALLPAVLVICFLGWFALLEFKTVQQVSGNSSDNEIKLFREQAESTLPIVVASPKTFIELAYYAPPEITSRLIYLVDPEAALKQLGHNSVERGMTDLVKPWFQLNVIDYKSYITSHQRFFVYGKLGSDLGSLNWIIPKLKEDGMRIELRATNGEKFLFLVYSNEQESHFSTQSNTEPSLVR